MQQFNGHMPNVKLLEVVWLSQTRRRIPKTRRKGLDLSLVAETAVCRLAVWDHSSFIPHLFKGKISWTFHSISDYITCGMSFKVGFINVK